ncbi:MAG: hypothetical protein ABI347_09885 [Nitrososphaera sp.]|jgi:CRISPR-associated protein Cst1
MKVELTGNPFVDTGLSTIAAIAGCHEIDDLTIEHIKKVHKNGERLARWNGQLKSMSMIFTINSLATHPGIKDPEKRVLYYSRITSALLGRIGKEDVEERCESCGNDRTLNIDALAREVLVPLGYKDAQRSVGRDWFPLAGSLGSDAQALPAGSRAPNICAKCLFAVHYLPLGTFLIDGRLIVFQSTSLEFWYGLVKSIVGEIEGRIAAGKIDTLGSKGSKVAVRKLVGYMRDMEDYELGPGTSLFMWQFSNARTGDLSIEEIPNPALLFLKKCAEHGLDKEVNALVAKEKGSQSLLHCISHSQDYYNLYPYKKFNGVSPELFQLYQKYVRSISTTRLKIAAAIAEYAKTRTDNKELEKLGKDTEKDRSKQVSLKKFIAEMASTGKMTYANYVLLFAKEGVETSVDYDAWKFIRYYLHNKPEFSEQDSAITTPDSLATHIGAAIFEGFVKRKGLDKFKRTVLEGLARGKNRNILAKESIYKECYRVSGIYLCYLAKAMRKRNRQRGATRIPVQIEVDVDGMGRKRICTGKYKSNLDQRTRFWPTS